MERTCSITCSNIASARKYSTLENYSITFCEGNGSFSIDLFEGSFSGHAVIFTTPWQEIHFSDDATGTLRSVWFHGDYYCIEHHKKEVACNGLLFNNIYHPPFILPNTVRQHALLQLTDQLEAELPHQDNYSLAVSRSYLQLILALCTRIMVQDIPSDPTTQAYHPIMQFRELLEAHFLANRAPSYYAEKLGMTPNNFSKKVKEYFLKSPSDLIQERVVLEAKKLIHLTYKSMKEIAATLHFEDEHYFSRYFKKYTGVSPSKFRETVGVSVVAQMSM
ncbi:AraC-like DNA-binding protein [Chitinophaga dinghuensis]|uniref:AraC-like DNA-binding protein n=1 Tax=Chitinophaga dinghuensis TaxID=1539050 RepID=A0A327VYB6_9BACT|nr:helix-turn-helix domain-containing protein [Chitinophaga dinghuensis]RAJ76752.1 AraC-like DNA-binding protein [Chitinophaga dinghuensis]